MQLLLDVQAEKLPFVLELIQQLDGVTIIRMENDQLQQLAQQYNATKPTETTISKQTDLSGAVEDLQNEIDELMG